MPINVTSVSTNTTITADTFSDIWVINPGIFVTVSGDDAINGTGSNGGKTFLIHGGIVSDGADGIDLGDPALNNGGDNFVHIYSTGSVFGDSAAVESSGGNLTLINDGSLSGLGTSSAVVLAEDGNNTITNTGTISASDNDAVRFFGGNNLITNTGTITTAGAGAFDAAVYFSSITGDVNTLINTGVLSGVTLAVLGDDGNEIIHNSGTIGGDVTLNNGDDIYNGSGAGVVSGMVLGGSGNDTLRGSDEADNLDGGIASDLIVGRGGDDTLRGDTGADTIRGGDGNDDIDGEVNADLINGNAGDDTILGSGGDDTIRGGRDDDELRGGNGADNIRGDSGDDLIIGGTGRDDMFGGAGNDVFVFESTSDSGTGAVRDRIFDFRSGEDTLDISSLAGPQFNFIGSGNFTGSGPQVRAVAAANGTLIYIDADGDGTRDSDIYLIGTSSVVEGDFLL